MELGTWGIFLLKMFVLLAGVYVIVILTPKFAALIDKRRKDTEASESNAPRPERVYDESTDSNDNCTDKENNINADKDADGSATNTKQER